MKKKILAIFLSIITIIFISTYPYSYWFVQFGFWLSFSTFEQIIFPTKRAKILNENGFLFKTNVCIPYKSLYGRYAIDVNLKNDKLKPFETKDVLLNNFDFYISIYDDKNQLLFYNTPQEVKEFSREKYNSVILNEYILPYSGCYKIKVKGIDKEKNNIRYLFFTTFLASEKA